MGLFPNEKTVVKATENYVKNIDGNKEQRERFGRAFKAGALTICEFNKINNKRMFMNEANMNAVHYSYTYYPGEDQEYLNSIRSAYFDGCCWADRELQFVVCTHLRNKNERQSKNKK